MSDKEDQSDFHSKVFEQKIKDWNLFLWPDHTYEMLFVPGRTGVAQDYIVWSRSPKLKLFYPNCVTSADKFINFLKHF